MPTLNHPYNTRVRGGKDTSVYRSADHVGNLKTEVATFHNRLLASLQEKHKATLAGPSPDDVKLTAIFDSIFNRSAGLLNGLAKLEAEIATEYPFDLQEEFDELRRLLEEWEKDLARQKNNSEETQDSSCNVVATSEGFVPSELSESSVQQQPRSVDQSGTRAIIDEALGIVRAK